MNRLPISRLVLILCVVNTVIALCRAGTPGSATIQTVYTMAMHLLRDCVKHLPNSGRWIAAIGGRQAAQNPSR
jgi:hypothetical protein